jgi:Co/Zn/Cd efflux system component
MAKNLLDAIETMYVLRCELELAMKELKSAKSALLSARRESNKLQDRMEEIMKNVIEMDRVTRSHSHKTQTNV